MVFRAVLMPLLFISTALCSAQTFNRYVTPLDHTLATPRAIAIHKGNVFLAYDGGDVCRFNDQAEFVQKETMLDEWYVVDLIAPDTILYACSNVGDVIGMNQDGGWEHIGRFDCEPFIDKNNVVYVVASGELRTVEYRDGTWAVNPIGAFTQPDIRVDAFAVRGDTVIYTANRDSTIRFSTVGSSWNNSIGTWAPVERLLQLEDGSIGIELGYRLSATLTTDPLVAPKLSPISYGSGVFWVENAKSIRRHNKLALVGRTFFSTGHPDNGTYVLFSKDSVIRLTEFDTLFDRSYQSVYHDGQWALASISSVDIYDDSLRGRHYHAYGDTEVNPFGGYAFTGTHAPYRTGSVLINGINVPALMPSTEQGSPLRVLDDSTKKTSYLRWYSRADDGSEVAISSRRIMHRAPNGAWANVFSVNNDPSWRRIVQPSRDVIALLSYGRDFIVSTDAGRTWNLTTIKGLFYGIYDLVVSSSTLFAISYDQVWSIDINAITDSLTPPVATFQPASFMRLMRSSDGTVNVVTGRSRTETIFNPTYFTHFQIYRWDPASGRIDSNEIELTKPVSAWFVQSTERIDTLYLWDSKEARLLAITNGGVAYDTTITSLGHRSFLMYDGVKTYTDVNGTWWLINEARNYAVALDPSRRDVVSVDEERPSWSSTVSPNPASDEIVLQFDGAPINGDPLVTVKVVDLFGKVVIDEQRTYDSHMVLSVAGLSNGIYFIVIKGCGGQSIDRVMINH